MYRWIDTEAIDRYFWSCWPPKVSIHRLKIFYLWSIVSIIDHKILIRTMTIDPSVYIQPMVSIHRSKINLSAHFSNQRKARKYCSIIGHGKYNGLKGLCQKICCTKTVKMKKAEVYSSIKSCIEYEHVYDFSSFYSDTFPLILVFYAAFYWKIYLCFLHFNIFAATNLLTLSLFTGVTFGWA